MSHPASKTRLLLFYLLLMLTFSFCRKTDSRKITEEWNIAEAKEWWYGEFKKSAAYKETDTRSPYAISFNYASANYSLATAMQKQLKKYPVWDMGALFKTGRFEIAEFPLIYPVKLAPMPQAAQLNDQQKKKIAECMLERVLMIKMPTGEKEVRIATIIPEFAYAASRNFDISNNSMHKLDKQFKGWVVIRKWNEAIVNIYEIEAGKITHVLRMDAMSPKKNATVPGNFAREECGYTSVMVWNKVCIEGPCEPPQDIPCINNCIDWYYVADVEWEWTCVETGDIDCGDGSLPYEDCMCYYYGLNCYNNGEGDDENTAANTPCAIADSLENNRALIYYQAILRQAVSGNKERMYVLTYQDDEYKYAIDTSGITDSLGVPDLVLNAGAQFDGVMHNHFDVARSLNIFSASDLSTLGNFFVNNAIRDIKTFIFTLTAQDGSNYNLVITNTNKFKNFIEEMLLNNNNIALEFLYMKYNILSSNSKEVNEKNFLSFLKNENSGLTVLKNDNGSWKWNPLKLENNGTVTTLPCE